MRRIATAITAAALALSVVAQASPAAAVTGYDSAYAGESAFLTLAQGATGSFTVFFFNTGTTTWLTGGSTQVDLAACLEDKTTCNAQDASESPFNSGWLSATRYATHTQTSVAPGQIGTFTYNVAVPADQAVATYRFNGALVLAATGADIHNEGYFQDVSVTELAPPPAVGAATLEALDPEEGSTAGGENVVITGEDIVCTPEPTVNFGDNEADVLSCGETTLTVETPPADEADTVDVTVTNAGADPSNALPFVYVDDVPPTFDAVSVEGQLVTLTFSEGVCVAGGALDSDAEFLVRVNGEEATVDSAEFADCDDDSFEATATVNVTAPTIVEGDTVSVTITSDGADLVEDAAGNAMERGQTRSTEAEADVTAPTITDAEATDHNELVLTADEPLDAASCEDSEGAFTFHREDDEDFVATAIACDEDEITLTFDDATFSDPDADEGSIEYDEDEGTISDVAENALESFELDITPLEAAGDPTIDDDVVAATGLRNEAEEDDVITITFSEAMDSETLGDIIRVQDADDTIADIECTEPAVNDNDVIEAACTFNDDYTVLSVRLLEDAGFTDANEETITDGDLAGVQWPAEIIDISGVEDGEGNPVDLEKSDDVSTNSQTDNTAPTVESAAAFELDDPDTGNIDESDAVILVMSEPVDGGGSDFVFFCASADPADFTWDDSDAVEAANTVTCLEDGDEDSSNVSKFVIRLDFDDIDAGDKGTLEYDGDPLTDDIVDYSGNDLADFTEEITPE